MAHAKYMFVNLVNILGKNLYSIASVSKSTYLVAPFAIYGVHACVLQC